jgi:hypothetical protein
MKRKPKLSQMVTAGFATRCLAGQLHGGQEDCHQQSYNSDCDKQFHER